MEINIQTWLLSASPIILFLLMMTLFNWGASRAGALSWLFTLAVSCIFFGTDLHFLSYTYIKAFLLSLDVLMIIWAALFLYQVTKQAGTIQRVGNELTRFSSNRSIQAIFLGWLFPSFLQGLGGFGVPVAISAPLLVNAGFSPIQSVLMASIGHAWAVTYGSMASSFQTLMAVTNLPGELLAPTTAFLLGFASFACGFLVIFIAVGLKHAVKTLPAVILIGAVMSASLYLLSVNRLWVIAVPLATLIALGVAFLVAQNGSNNYASDRSSVQDKKNPGNGTQLPSLLDSVMPYGILIGLTFMLNLIKPLNNTLGFLKFTIQFPEITTRLGDITQPEPGRVISILNHPGTIIIVSALLSYWFFSNKGFIPRNGLMKIFKTTKDSALQTTIAIFTMVGIAVIMTHTQMTRVLALGLSRVLSQRLFPFLSPIIGALGAFITGSNNNSNVIFSPLQRQTAELLGLNIYLILGAQTAGGALGSVLSPAKVIVGCSTVGLAGSEGKVMGKLILYGMIPICLVAIAVLLIAEYGWKIG